MENNMESETENNHGSLFESLQWIITYGAALIAAAYSGSLWTTANTKTASLAQCEAMLPNLTIDCPLAAQVAECAVANPFGKCEVTR